MTIGAFFSMALAIEILCFSPPDKCPPPSPTIVSYPADNPRINSSQPDNFAISSTSISLADGFPILIFSLTDISNR